MSYIDPQSDLVKAVLVKKATQLATEALELLLDEAEAHGLSRNEALAIVDRTIGELRQRDESDQVFQRLREGLEAEIEGRSDV